ncbi:MAG: hypothetical protein CR988_02570 [Treponema sp.]|nr:MAG: hypothetical protein CR988_02570 [Treponema sp.]
MKVLIFDKNVSFLTIIKKKLCNFGFETILVYSHEDFFKIFERSKPTFIIFNEVVFQNERREVLNRIKRVRCFLISYLLNARPENKIAYVYKWRADFRRSRRFKKASKMVSLLIQLCFLQSGYYTFLKNAQKSSLQNLKNIANEFPSEFTKPLTKMAYRILCILNEAKNEGIAPAEIANRIWGSCSIKKLNSIYVHISYLRKQIKIFFKGKYSIIKKKRKYRLVLA